MNSLVMSLGDFYVIKILYYYYGKIPSISVIMFFMCNWFYLGTMSRTYMNGFETSLTIVAFYYWLNRENNANDIISRVIVWFCYLVRATSLIFWAVVWPYELWTMYFFYKKSLFVCFKFILKNLIQM